MVFSTAFGTAVLGLLIDNGVTIDNIAFIAGLYIVTALLFLILFIKQLDTVKIKIKLDWFMFI